MMGRVKRALKVILIVLILISSGKAIYLKYQIESPTRALEIAGVPENESLIAVYHNGNTWQFATYSKRENTLRVYTVEWNPLFAFFLWRLKKGKESAKAIVDYSPLVLNTSLIEEYSPHEKALLFKSIGWVYGKEITSRLPALSEVIANGEKYYSITGTGSKDGFWIKMKIICDPPSLFAIDYVCRGFIGYEGLLTIPGYNLKDGRMTWIIEKPQGDFVNVTVFYPGISLSKLVKQKKKDTKEPLTFTGRSIRLLREAVPDYVNKDIIYIELDVRDDVNYSYVGGMFLLPHDRYGSFEESVEGHEK